MYQKHFLEQIKTKSAELGFDEFVEFAKLTLNSNGGKIVPKLEELKECFYHIDADGGGVGCAVVNSVSLSVNLQTQIPVHGRRTHLVFWLGCEPVGREHAHSAPTRPRMPINHER